MITFLVGKIEAVKNSEYKNKSTGTITYNSAVTISYKLIDKNGDVDLGIEKVMFDVADLQILKDNIGKYIAVPFVSGSGKNGTFIFHDSNFNYLLLEKDPFSLKNNNK